MSASSSPTEAPLLRRAAARLTATVDLPTPPLPDAMAMVCLTPGRISEGLGRRNAGRTLAVIRMSTPVTPGSSPIASSACYLKRSRTTLAGAHVDAVVAMDFFSSQAGVLCGVAEAVRLLSAILQEGDQAWAIAEGAAMEKKETVLRVRAPYSRFGVYETALLGMLSSCSGWATAAREI